MRPGQAPLARITPRAYLARIGVPLLPPATCAFDPGYDPLTLECHLEQSAHLISILKLSMACWLVADEAATRRKIEAVRTFGVPTTTGGGPFEIAVAQGELPAYLALCAEIGFDRIECGAGFVDLALEPAAIVASARAVGLEVQYELGRKHGGTFTHRDVAALVDDGLAWLDAGAVQLVVEARESAAGVGLFDRRGRFDGALADASPRRSGSAGWSSRRRRRRASSRCSTISVPRSTSGTSGSRSCSASRSTGGAALRRLRDTEPRTGAPPLRKDRHGPDRGDRLAARARPPLPGPRGRRDRRDPGDDDSRDRDRPGPALLPRRL